METKKELKYNWYAMYTKPRWEKKVYDLLNDKGIDVFLPMITTTKVWSDRKKKVTEPLLKSYIFVKVSEKEYYDAVNTDGAVSYIRFEGKAAPIPEWQIDIVKKIIEKNIAFNLSNEHFAPGEKIIIEYGDLSGQTGEIIRTKSGQKKLIVRIGELGYTLEIDSEAVGRLGGS